MIKVGDTVLVSKSIRYNFSSFRSFLVPATIDRETKTQWIIGDSRYKKDGLCQIGKHYLKIETDLSKSEVKEMREFRRLCSMVNDVGYHDGLGRLNVDMAPEKIHNAYDAYKAFEAAMREAVER